jgi:hypothetical protein
VGVPVLVDPMTYLSQDIVDEANAWVRLPFGVSRAMTAIEMMAALRRPGYVEHVIQFQIDQRASAIIPPYFHSQNVNDPWFEATLVAIFETNRAMERMRVGLPLIPVLSARLDRFGKDKTWGDGLDRFADTAQLHGARAVATQLGPVGKPDDGYARVFDLFSSLVHLQRHGLDVLAFRQGMYGAALTTVGVAGFETGISYGDATNVSALITSRRPHPTVEEEEPEKQGGGPGARIYVPSFGRFVSGKDFEVLNANLSTRALLVCDDPIGCCSEGITSTQHDRRAHSVRSRAREIAAVTDTPPSWQLQQVELTTRKTMANVQSANRVLAGQGIKPMHVEGLESLVNVLEYFRHDTAVAA